MQQIKTLCLVGLLIWSYYLVYSFYVGLTNTIPEAGDGWDYHIPIAYTILDGSFLHPENFKLPQWYYPGSAELVNVFFIWLHIPLTISNIFAVILLFFVCFKFASVFNLKYYFSLLFAITIVTLNAIFRWYNDLTLDVLLAIFFLWGIMLLEKPQKTFRYFLKLGFIFGMLIGTKFTGFLFAALLGAIYIRNIYKRITLKNFFAFLIPFSIFGLFWYVRNYIFTGNPFYPLGMLGFHGPLDSNDPMIRETFLQPIVMFNAAFGEYKLWLFSLLVALGTLIYQFLIKKNWKLTPINKLFLIGLISFCFFLSFPTSPQPWIMVSSFRYSFPFFIPLILGVFLLAEKYKKETLLGYVAVGCMINVLSLAYYPKLVILSIPLAFLVMYFFDKYKNRLS